MAIKEISMSRWFTDKFHQTFKEEIALILHSILQAIEMEENLNSFYETNVTLTLKPGIDSSKKQTN